MAAASNHPEPGAAMLVMGALTRDDIPALCRRLRVLGRRRDVKVVVCRVADLPADVVGLDALARVQLTARRLGCGVVLRDASPELRRLLAVCGLAAVIPCDDS